jgi:hypothetical protein
MKTIIACDPGVEGGCAIFRNDPETGWYLDTIVKNENWKDLAKLELYQAVAIIEKNHGIQGQTAGDSYAQGFNAGTMHARLELIAKELHTTPPQHWQSVFGVPRKKTFEGKPDQQSAAQKRWTRDKCQTLTGEEFPIRVADAVAIGLVFIKEMKAGE